MNARDDMNRASRELDRAGDHTQEAARQTGEAAHHTKEAMEAGASGTLERTKEAARETGRKVGHAAEQAADVARDAGRTAARVAEAEDVDLKHRVGRTTENVVQKAGDALRGAAPTVGRGAAAAVGATGAVLSAAGGLLGTVVGKIAGRVGGWWNEAAEAIAELPEEEQQACRIHFESHTLRPGGMTFEHALPGYTLGYVAARNPDYRGRRFEEIEPDLRHGFGGEQGMDYDSLRDFTRYGYERGITGV